MDIIIAVGIAGLMLLTAYLGVHVTMHPVELARARTKYKIGFLSCALIACCLVGLQAYRNEIQSGALQQQITKIEQKFYIYPAQVYPAQTAVVNTALPCSVA